VLPLFQQLNPLELFNSTHTEAKNVVQVSVRTSSSLQETKAWEELLHKHHSQCISTVTEENNAKADSAQTQKWIELPTL